MQFFKRLAKFFKNMIRAPGQAAEPHTLGYLTEQESIIINNNHSHKKNRVTMAMFNYGVGGNEVKVDANEAIQEIQENKTLIVSKLTNDAAVNPEIVTGLKTPEDVFQHFKPSISIDHETEDGQSVTEDFKFNNLGDFTPKNMTQNSSFLKNLSIEQEHYNKIVRQLRNNKVLRNILADEQSKNALLDALKTVAAELKSN